MVNTLHRDFDVIFRLFGENGRKCGRIRDLKLKGAATLKADTFGSYFLQTSTKSDGLDRNHKSFDGILEVTRLCNIMFSTCDPIQQAQEKLHSCRKSLAQRMTLLVEEF